MTSLIRCFCPLYVVKMAILSAGYPIRRMYMKIATAYSASPRFYKNKQDKEWRIYFGNNGFTDFRVRFITISNPDLVVSFENGYLLLHWNPNNRIIDPNDLCRRWITWILPNTGFFGNMILNISVPRILKEWLYHQVQRVYHQFDFAAHRCGHFETPNMD